MNARARMTALSGAVVLVGLACLVIVLGLDAPVKAAAGDSPVAVSIAEGGFEPAVVTIPVGTTVEWTNHTAATVHLMSGMPFHVFLPLVVRAGGSTGPASASRLAATGGARQGQGGWADVDIPVGGSYGHTFAAAGTYPYYLRGEPGKRGRVVVEEVPEPDFALAAWPATQTITRCQIVSYTVAVTALHGFAQPVGLEVGGVPAGATVDWATNPIIPTAETTLSITPSLLSPAGAYTLLITGTGGAVHTTQAGLEVVADPKEDHIPCLVIVGQQLGINLPPVTAGCVSGETSISWRYNPQGAFIGFDLEVRDDEVIVLEASIDIERSPIGRIVSYEGPVWGPGFPDYYERAVNEFDAYHGGLLGADVTKVYPESGDRYEMEITEYCPYASADEITGYRVGFCGQAFTVGSCP
jgi:plastocyanin